MLSWPWLALCVLAHLDESKVSHPHSKKANTFAICLWGFESIWFSSEHPHSRPPQNFCTSSPPSKPAWKKSKAVLMADSLELIFTSGCYDFWVKSNQWTFPFLECYVKLLLKLYSLVSFYYYPRKTRFSEKVTMMLSCRTLWNTPWDLREDHVETQSAGTCISKQSLFFDSLCLLKSTDSLNNFISSVSFHDLNKFF